MSFDLDEPTKDGIKAIFTSGGGGTLSAKLGAAAFNAYAQPHCHLSPLSTGGLCLTKQWQVLGMTFHSASAAAAFFGPAIGAVLVVIWIIRGIHDVREVNARR